MEVEVQVFALGMDSSITSKGVRALAHLYQSYRSEGPDEIRIFRDEGDAWRWLSEPAPAP